MITKEIILVALRAIRANILRSFLTTLGIIIGVGAVITMVALGEGAQQDVEEQIERMGTNVLTVQPDRTRGRGGVAGEDQHRLHTNAAEMLREEAGDLLDVAPTSNNNAQISYLRWNTRSQVLGSWPTYFNVYDLPTAHGRPFDWSEVDGRRRVAVVGYDIPEQLNTPGPLLVGQTIQVRGERFEVVGVLEEKGEMGFARPDATVFIPLSTYQYRLFGGQDRLGSILVSVNGGQDEMNRAYDVIDGTLRQAQRIPPGSEPNFEIRNATDLLQTFQETGRTFTFLLAGIAGVSLLVGGIGIMNIMLVSVTERTREIGVRKALGATRRNILFQFMVEALVLCTLGGLLGVLAGSTGAAVMGSMAGWDMVVSMEAVVVALLFSACVGLFFGMWPAHKASKLDPIVALRYE